MTPFQPTPPAFGEWFDVDYRRHNLNAHGATESNEVSKKKTPSVGSMTEA